MAYHITQQAAQKLETATQSHPGLQHCPQESMLGEIMTILRNDDPAGQALAESFMRMDEKELAHFASYMHWLEDLALYQPPLQTRRDIIRPVVREIPLFMDVDNFLTPESEEFQSLIRSDRVSGTTTDTPEPDTSHPAALGAMPEDGRNLPCILPQQ